MGRKVTTTYVCDWCREESADTDFLGNHLVVNWRQSDRREWELCNGCFDRVHTAVEQLRSELDPNYATEKRRRESMKNFGIGGLHL